MWKWLEQYFTFTKSERNAVVALIVIGLLVLVAPKVYFCLKPVQHADNSKYDKEVADFINEHNRHQTSFVSSDSTFRSFAKKDSSHAIWRRPAEHYFVFDPNKIGVKEWVQLGFTEKQAITIEHYKAKGAKFYKPVDLKRLFVMTDEHYEKLLPYVKIDVAALPERHRE